MNEEARHWTDNQNSLYSDEDRTKNLVDHISMIYQNFIGKTIIQGNIFAELEKQTKIDDLFTYLKKHPDMLKYKFDEEGQMSKIEVDPNRKFTFLDDSKRRQCDMSRYITDMLTILLVNSDKLWQTNGGVMVDMSNVGFCSNYHHAGGTTPLRNSISDGDHKSRRKPARKTRRGRGRKFKSMSKSKTHRHRRHSRISKHKKYTSRRR